MDICLSNLVFLLNKEKQKKLGLIKFQKIFFPYFEWRNNMPIYGYLIICSSLAAVLNQLYNYSTGYANGDMLVICCEGNAGFYEIGMAITPLEAEYSVLGWNHPGFGGSTVIAFVVLVKCRISVNYPHLCYAGSAVSGARAKRRGHCRSVCSEQIKFPP